jgi:hypothetical protein
MRTYRVLFWIEIDAIDRGDAEKIANRLLKSKKLDAKLYSIEEG